MGLLLQLFCLLFGPLNADSHLLKSMPSDVCRSTRPVRARVRLRGCLPARITTSPSNRQ